MEIFKANRQWSQRPPDERFNSLGALYKATYAYAQQAREVDRRIGDMRVEVVDQDVQLVGRQGNPAQLTHWAFGQLCRQAQAPGSYLRCLPATLAVQNLNHGLALLPKEDKVRLLVHLNGKMLLRAITTDSYTRIWNHEIASRLVGLQDMGWEPARPDHSSPAAAPALYASDHDMFAFLRQPNRVIKEPGSDQPIWRGWIIENSEVGKASLKCTRFLYRYMCSNHIIWGASHIVDLTVRHIGKAAERMQQFFIKMQHLDNASASEEEAMILKAKQTVIAATKGQVLDAIFGKRALNLSRKVIEAGYEAVQPTQDGDPRTVWGIVNGLTRHTQTIPYADQRNVIEVSAGKLLTAQF